MEFFLKSGNKNGSKVNGIAPCGHNNNNNIEVWQKRKKTRKH